MKRIVCIGAILLLIAGVAFAKGGQEEPQSFKLVLVNNGKGPFAEGSDAGEYATPWDRVLGEFAKENPNIEVILVIRDVAQGSLTVDALMAKGTPPDVWWDATGYFPKYMVEEYALPLEKYLDTSKWQKDLVDLYTREGHVYVLPAMNVVAAMAINLDMLDAIGYTMPAQPEWTIEEFNKVSAKLKAQGIPSTMVMTKDGLIGWMMPWMYAFGAEFYKDMDHTKVAINSPEGVEALKYIRWLDQQGYGYPFPNEQNDDAGVELFGTAKVFSCMLQNGHADGFIPEAVKQGKLEKAFAYDFVEFPHKAGLAHTPVSGYQSGSLAHNSGNEAKNAAIAKLAAAASGAILQEEIALAGGGFPTLVGLELPARGALARQSTRNLMGLAQSAGLMELGNLEPFSRELRRPWIIPIQELMEGKVTAEQVLAQYEKEANAIIAAAK